MSSVQILSEICTTQNFSPRKPQILMAQMIDKTLDHQCHLVIPADTGVGKSLAYAAAAINEVHRGGRVLISTSTKILQDQLLNDLPYWVEDRHTTVQDIRGKNNYRCPLLQEQAPTLELRTFQGATRSSFEGDPEHWDQFLSVSSEDCLGSKCSLRNICPSVEASNNLERADVVVTNHSMLALHLRTRFLERINKFSLFIVDEAHDLEGYILKVMGAKITGNRLRHVDKRLKPIAYDGTALQGFADELDLLLTQILSKDTEVRISASSIKYNLLTELLLRTKNHLLQIRLDSTDARYDRAERLVDNLSHDIGMIEQWKSSDQSNGIMLAKQNGNKPMLELSPLSVANWLQTRLWENEPSVILTSATLPRDIGSKLGMPGKRTKEVWDLPPVFDYTKQGLLFVPSKDRRDLFYKYGTPNHGKIGGDLTPRSKFLLNILMRVPGGSLVLFASRYDMDNAYRVMSLELRKQGRLVLKQGDQSNPILMDMFRNHESSALFAVKSFEQGVDFPGPTLQCVVFDRIPNPPSKDLWIKALTDFYGNYVKAHKPTVYNRMRQAAGRAIRTTDDRALIVVLDHRFVNLTKHLQEFRTTSNVSLVVEWLDELKNDLNGGE